MVTKRGGSELVNNDNSEQEEKLYQHGTAKKASGENKDSASPLFGPCITSSVEKKDSAPSLIGTSSVEKKDSFLSLFGPCPASSVAKKDSAPSLVGPCSTSYVEKKDSALSLIGPCSTSSAEKKDSAPSAFGPCFKMCAEKKGSAPSAFGPCFTSCVEKKEPVPSPVGTFFPSSVFCHSHTPSVDKRSLPSVFSPSFTSSVEKKESAASAFGHRITTLVEKKDSFPEFARCVEKKDWNKDYPSHLKALNIQMVEWIKKQVGENPLVILTPVFKDYEKHLQSITENQMPSSSFRATASQPSLFFGENANQKVPFLEATTSQTTPSFAATSCQLEPSYVATASGSLGSSTPTVSPVVTGGFSLTTRGYEAFPGQTDEDGQAPHDYGGGHGRSHHEYGHPQLGGPNHQAAPKINSATGHPDYSAQWAEFYRSFGMNKEAEMIAVGPGETSNRGSPTTDYSAQWCEYYRSVGKYKEADAIETQMRAKMGGESQPGYPGLPQPGHPGQPQYQSLPGYPGQPQFQQTGYDGYRGH